VTEMGGVAGRDSQNQFSPKGKKPGSAGLSGDIVRKINQNKRSDIMNWLMGNGSAVKS